MKWKRFFSKRLNLIVFVTVIFALITVAFAMFIPNYIFNTRLDEIEMELHDLVLKHETVTEVDSTEILYIYKNGESSMLTSTGYISEIDYDVEHHLIHWSEDQFVETLLYEDDFQDKLFIYYIYVVEQDYYVVAFADTKEVHMFVDNFRNSSLISIGIFYVISIVFTSTFFSSSLIKQYSLFDPVTNLNTRMSLLNKYGNKDLSSYKIQYANIYNLQDIIEACGARYNDIILKMLSNNITQNYPLHSVYQLSESEYIIINNEDLDFHKIINKWDTSMVQVSPYEFKIKTVDIDPSVLKESTLQDIIKQFTFAYSKIRSKKAMHYTITQELVNEMHEEQYYLSHLGLAIKEGKMINFYQPKVDPNTSKIIGAEALSRWKEDDSIISPSKYIHLAETNGMIYDIDIISFRNSLKFLKSLEVNNLLPEYFRLSSNFSPITLKNISFEEIKNIIETEAIHPKHISIEITESVVLEFDVIEELLSKLSEYGITLEIDDFSAGNSSFTMLSLINANVVKLDRAILPEKEEDEREKLIYNSLVDISKKIGLKIISEGVENDLQKTFVKDLGVEGIQGYFYSKPLNKSSFIEYVRNNI